jgi:hypothetical protein
MYFFFDTNPNLFIVAELLSWNYRCKLWYIGMAALKVHVIWVYGPLSDGAKSYIREINRLQNAECKFFTSVRKSLQ